MADRHTPQLQSASSSAAEDRAVRKLETELQRVLARKVPLEELLTQAKQDGSFAKLRGALEELQDCVASALVNQARPRRSSGGFNTQSGRAGNKRRNSSGKNSGSNANGNSTNSNNSGGSAAKRSRRGVSRARKRMAQLEEEEADMDDETGPGARSWDDNFASLAAFVEQFGHSRVPKVYRENPPLGRWVTNQRRAYKAEEARKDGADPASSYRISAEHIEKLDSIGFEWVVRANGRPHIIWDDMFAKLQEYIRTHGNANVPKRYPADLALSRWANNQRRAFKAELNRKSGRKPSTTSRISPQRIAKLEAVGFQWNVGTAKGQVPWDEQFAKLEAFIEERGHTRVPYDYPQDPAFGWWVSTQRKACRAEQARSEGRKPSSQYRITPDRVEKLRSVGFGWNRKATAWDEQYSRLVRFINKHGHARVPANSCPALAHWVSSQRQAYRAERARKAGRKPPSDKRITPERIAKLEALGFLWNAWPGKPDGQSTADGHGFLVNALPLAVHPGMSLVGQYSQQQFSRQPPPPQQALEVGQEAARSVPESSPATLAIGAVARNDTAKPEQLQAFGETPSFVAPRGVAQEGPPPGGAAAQPTNPSPAYGGGPGNGIVGPGASSVPAEQNTLGHQQ